MSALRASAFGQLAATSLRELVRDRLAFGFALLLPFLFFGLFLLIGSDAGRPADASVDPVRQGVPAMLIFAFSSLALFGTAMPLVELRSRGTLRLLATTPVSRTCFVLAQAPARLAVAGVQLAGMLISAAAVGTLEPERLPRLLLTASLGLAMVFALGFCLGGLLRSPELTSNLLGALLPVVLLLSGVLVPLALLPEAVQAAAHLSPFTFFGDAMRQDLVAQAPAFPLWLDYAVMAAATAALTVLTVRTFDWAGEER